MIPDSLYWGKIVLPTQKVSTNSCQLIVSTVWATIYCKKYFFLAIYLYQKRLCINVTSWKKTLYVKQEIHLSYAFFVQSHVIQLTIMLYEEGKNILWKN